MEKQFPDIKPGHSRYGFNDPDVEARMVNRCMGSSCEVNGDPVMCQCCGYKDKAAFLVWEADNEVNK
jgi:hypothetical protein